ncbi:hypothetical protein EI94DRAFT_1814222 [Lactarius quietus]|nr:hypothetical protein EI94DRAFT_1814222 [Lactarius quietus]
MPDNDGDGDSSSFSESASLGTLPSGQSVGLASSICQLSNGENCDLEASLEGHGGDCSVDKDATLPPLGVKLTGYRLLFMMTIFSFGTIKGILTYMGQSIAPNTLDWVSGTFLAVVLYWIGLYEDRDSDKWRWFFQVDLSPAIGHCAKRVVGRLMWPLSFLGNALRIVLLSMWLVFLALARAISYFAKRVVGGFVWLLSYLDNPYSIVFLSLSLTALGGYIRARYFPHVPLGPVLAVHAGVSVVALLLGAEKFEYYTGDGSMR